MLAWWRYAPWMLLCSMIRDERQKLERWLPLYTDLLYMLPFQLAVVININRYHPISFCLWLSRVINVRMLIHTYPNEPLREIIVVICNHYACSHFTCGQILCFANRREYGQTWHWMSLLWSGVMLNNTKLRHNTLHYLPNNWPFKTYPLRSSCIEFTMP